MGNTKLSHQTTKAAGNNVQEQNMLYTSNNPNFKDGLPISGSKGLGSSQGNGSVGLGSSRKNGSIGFGSSQRDSQHKPVRSTWDDSFPDTGIHYGVKRNLYVLWVQKVLLPSNLWTGNFLGRTKAAIATFVKEHDIKYQYPDGSVLTQDLYNIIDNFHKTGDVDQTQQQATPATAPAQAPASATQQQPAATDNNTQTTYGSSSVIRFPLYLNSGKESDNAKYLVYDLQTAVGAKRTGLIDQQTVDAVRRFITDQNNITTMGIDQPDSRDLSLINNTDDPAITQRLYNSIIAVQNDKYRQAGKMVHETLKKLVNILHG